MTPLQHVRRVALLAIATSLLLGWLTAHTQVFFADGLRYIKQAKTIDQGAWSQGLIRSVDHPVYPLAIATAHRLLGGDRPQDWQSAAQLASAIAGVLLVIPVYLLALEIFGAAHAWFGCLLIYLLPFNCHVLADVLSESTFLLFWSAGLWSALRYLRSGRLTWLFPFIIASVLSYLTRPEGLILPLALVASLLLLALRPGLGLPLTRTKWAIVVLVLGPILTAGPFMLMKGGISTKPSIARILGLAPRAGAMGVERERPLEPGQSELKTVLVATVAMLRAIARATTFPLLALAPLGIVVSYSAPARRRFWPLLGMIVGLSVLGMIRLHTMAGYCTPRHAMVISWILIPAGAAGLNRVVAWIGLAATRLVGRDAWSATIEVLATGVSVGSCLVVWGPATVAPMDLGFVGYRQAGEWLASSSGAGDHVIDLKGFSLYYAGRPGYTFATLADGLRDPAVRWVVVHDALLHGPWDYSRYLLGTVGNRRPVRVFPARPAPGVSVVYLFDLSQPLERTAGTLETPSRSRR